MTDHRETRAHRATWRIAAALGILAGGGCGPRRAPDLVLAATEAISTDRTFKQRTLRIVQPSDEGALVVETDGVVVDLAGGDLVGAPDGTPPDRHVGFGIVVRGASNVVIRNARVRGFKVAIYAEDAPGLTIENCDVSDNYRRHLRSTPEREHLDDWLWGHENDDNQWLRYGAGIYLLRCDGARVLANRARNGQNGICLANTNHALVRGNDLSFMSGWGLAMWRSNVCRVLRNRFDFCVRGYSHGVYARGQDSTGILVYEQCSDNVFAYNSATHGGDGFFLYAGNETVKQTGEGGCNRNLVYRNDFSYAVANGIEATFSDQNVFAENTLDHCVHGVWAGYSRNSLIAGNAIGDCDNGVSIEHGGANRIEWNEFERCGVGVDLWWDDDKDLLASPYGRKQGGRSRDERVRRNRFINCKTAVRATDSADLELGGNHFETCERVVQLRGGTTVGPFLGNAIYGGLVDNQTRSVLTGYRNFGATSVTSAGPVDWQRPAADHGEAWTAAGRPRANSADHGARPRVAWSWPLIEATHIPAVKEGVPEGAGAEPIKPLPGVPQGKENILVDDWGPYDFSSAKVHPARGMGWESVAVRVLAPQAPFKATVEAGAVTVTPSSGTAPATVTIRPRSVDPGMSAYSILFDVGGTRLKATGVLMRADWDVVFYKWSKEADPRGGDDVWRRIVAADPIHRERTGKIDFVWGGRGPVPGLSGDHFAAVAVTKITLPAGRWRLRTVSDDGVRVVVDGEKVIDNWTWHVPTEDAAEVDLTAGEHELKIEYFEISGHAQLQFFMEPAEP